MTSVATSHPTATGGLLTVDGARLYYEVRGAGPAVLLIGNPMDAEAFAPLATALADGHTVVTTDPRGIRRSPVADADRDVSAEVRAADLAALLVHLALTPAVVVGSSGGAVSALALAQYRPDLVRAVVAHKAPLTELLDDREARRAATETMIATYLSGDVAGAWALFLAEANLDPSDPADGPQLPSEPDPQAVDDERFFFAHLLRPTTRWQPDLARLRAGGARIIVGIGSESAGQVCDLTSRALAAGLRVPPTLFPGDHLGFLADPPAFADRLREVIHSA